MSSETQIVQDLAVSRKFTVFLRDRPRPNQDQAKLFLKRPFFLFKNFLDEHYQRINGLAQSAHPGKDSFRRSTLIATSRLKESTFCQTIDIIDLQYIKKEEDASAR